MFNINDKEIKELEADLMTFGRRAFPFATKSTLNNTVFTAQKLARKDARVKMIQRNKFTEQSIQVDQARTLQVSRQAATVGSTADYMEDQEFGGTKRKTGTEGVAIPTSYSAGQGEQEPRTRLPRKANKLDNINLSKRLSKAKTNNQKLIIKMFNAVKTGNRFFFHDMGRKKGVFRVIGGSKHSTRWWPAGAKMRMVHDMTEDSVNIPRNPWLKPAVDRTQVLIPDMYKKALQFQLRRLGLFR